MPDRKVFSSLMPCTCTCMCEYKCVCAVTPSLMHLLQSALFDNAIAIHASSSAAKEKENNMKFTFCTQHYKLNTWSYYYSVQ